MSADSIEQAVRFGVHKGGPVTALGTLTMPTTHRVTEFTTRNPGMWIDGNDWGMTVRTEDGHEVEVDAEVIEALRGACVTHSPMPCHRTDCLNLADPDDTDQACREHGAGSRWDG